MAKDKGSLILIKKEEVVEGGHHGGAWKVAYADFVTAMMAFFLLMWLLNSTSPDQKKGLADYFGPHNEMGQRISGSGLPFGGRTPNSTGSLVSDQGSLQMLESTSRVPETPPPSEDDGTDPLARGSLSERMTQVPSAVVAGGPRPYEPTQARQTQGPPTDKDIQAELENRERQAFERAAQQIRDTIATDPALADLGRQLMIDVTPEGLRIQLVDAEKQPMFPSGSASLNERARAVLAKIAPVLLRLPEQISVTGHTDSSPYKGADRTNWDLSADRANATRRLLMEAGLPEARIRSVAGMADRDPLVADDRLAAANRRIAVVVLRDKPAAAK